MKRITVDMVKDAYEKTGLRPKSECFFDADCACAIGALYFLEKSEQSTSGAREWADDKFGETYTDGFIYGFDGQFPSWEDNKQYMRGFLDGCEVARRVFNQ